MYVPSPSLLLLTPCCIHAAIACSILSWAIAVMAGLFAVHTLGINIKPLLAVGGASSLIIGLATQTLLTNAVMGVSIFLSRPFVPGDSITVQQQGGVLVSGVVEKVTPMRTLLRTDDDVLVTLPNKVRCETLGGHQPHAEQLCLQPLLNLQ